jgi:phosphatidylglycerophosphate synthase
VNVYINPANAVTASRYLALPPFFYCIQHGLYQWATVAVILCGVADLFDGALARRLGCTSGFGELFDAVTDGVCYSFFLVVLAYFGWVPWTPVLIILAMGGINSLLRAIHARRAGRAINYRSFAMERLVAFAAFLAGLGIARMEVTYYYYTCAALMVVVVVHDFKRMILDPVPA